jgi:Ca2+-transporting ATPase
MSEHPREPGAVTPSPGRGRPAEQDSAPAATGERQRQARGSQPADLLERTAHPAAARGLSTHRQSAAEVALALDVDPRTGLSTSEATGRLARHGRNELASERPQPAWRRFLAQFQDVLVILLLVATAISAGLWIYERESALPYEALAIFAVVLLNAILGYVQEARAASAVAALLKMAAAHAHVVRDGERQDVPATDVVPGDIIVVEEGDTVPADARLVHAVALQAAEGSLTGESLPVAKDTALIAEDVAVGDRHNMLFSGTAVTYGRGRAVVVATGMQTEMGHIAGLLATTKVEVTPLQRQLARVGRVLGLIVLAIAAVMITAMLVMQDVSGFAAVFDILILGVALAVAAVPEGLPAVVTAVLSLGVQRAARKNAIVRHLSAVETLGSARSSCPTWSSCGSSSG